EARNRIRAVDLVQQEYDVALLVGGCLPMARNVAHDLIHLGEAVRYHGHRLREALRERGLRDSLGGPRIGFRGHEYHVAAIDIGLYLAEAQADDPVLAIRQAAGRMVTDVYPAQEGNI